MTTAPWIASVISSSRRILFTSLVGCVAACLAVPALAQDNGTSVEGCIGCHGAGGEVPVGDITNPHDPHYIDTNPLGPKSDAGYRQLDIDITSIDVTGTTMIADFEVRDENGREVEDIFAADGRIVLARLIDGVVPGDDSTAGNPTDWHRVVNGERFTTSGGTFEALGGAKYRYTTVFNPQSIPGKDPIAQGDTLRAAIQISSSDIPPGNGWCDFDADLSAPNGCDGPVSLTRDIVQTSTCNECHGPTSDSQLRIHGYRTQVEYCVTCHNPDLGEADMTNMVHKIHAGSQLTQPFYDGDFDHVNFTRNLDNCNACHTTEGADADNWKTKPTRNACGSCHDDVNFEDGTNHGSGGPRPDDQLCTNCHPTSGNRTSQTFPIPAVHPNTSRADERALNPGGTNQTRIEEAGLYRGDGNGYSIASATYDSSTDQVTVRYSVTRDGQKMILQTDDRWKNGARLSLAIGWNTEDFSNEGSLGNTAPGQPAAFNALDVGGVVTDLGGGMYEIVADVPEGASGNLSALLEGHAAVLTANANWESVPVRDAIYNFSLDRRPRVNGRRAVVSVDKCNACHDASGAGLSLHGENRTIQIQSCVTCHNGDATDVRRRPDPGPGIDGKFEESIDFKKMIHSIHAGGDLQDGLVVYGYGGFSHDYSKVEFTGTLANCETCHYPGTYGADDAWGTLATTIDSGAKITDPVTEPTDPSDDLNISAISSVCSSCHDSDVSKEHMVKTGGSFMALDANIVTGPSPVPEPGRFLLAMAALATLGLLARRRDVAGDDRRS